jgi:hypothetical protein
MTNMGTQIKAHSVVSFKSNLCPFSVSPRQSVVAVVNKNDEVIEKLKLTTIDS